MSSSHSSLLSSVADEELPLEPTLDDTPADEQPSLLHLVPCTWEHFLKIDPPASGLYEYVDGYVIWCPNMADSEHVIMGDDHGTVLSCSQDVKVIHTPSIQLVNGQNRRQCTSNHDRNSPEHEDESSPGRNGASSSRDRNSVSSTRDPVQIQSDMRHPDFAIVKTRSDSATSSTTSRDPLAKKRIVYSLPLTTDLLALVEITSRSTRNTDLNSKWISYARSKVPMYIIIDRGTGREGTKRVIVGTQSPLEDNALRSKSADKQVSPASASEQPPFYYYRKVYCLNDVVNCPYYSHLDLEASKLLDLDFMKNLARRMDNKRRGQARRTQVVEQKLGRTEQERDEAKQERDEAKQKVGRTEQERDEAKQERDDALRQLESYKSKDRGDKNSRRGSSSKSGSPERKKTRK